MKELDSEMNSLVVIAPAKINFHLEILGLRDDGFHELAMVMQAIDLADRLMFRKNSEGKITLSCDIKDLSTSDDNLIVRSALLLKNCFQLKGLGADIRLEKNIPIGAGLAGGSTDAAATLVGLNELWELGLPIKELEGLACELGSDVPFCLEGGTQLCFGRGETLEPKSKASSSMALILVKDPSASVSTPWAYGRYREKRCQQYLVKESDFESCRKSLREASWLNPLWGGCLPPLRNDLQQVVEPVTPSVQLALKLLRDIPGNLGVAMSGSGPSCFALFPDIASANSCYLQNKKLFEQAGLMSWCCELRDEGVTIETYQ